MELKTGLFDNGFGAERFVASLIALTSFEAYNTSYTARFTRPNFDFVKTSHSRGTLYDIPNPYILNE